jgi:hypothetical protein
MKLLRSIGLLGRLKGPSNYFLESSAEFCSTSPARTTGHNLHGTHRKRSGATGTDRIGVAQPDSISIELHGRAARANNSAGIDHGGGVGSDAGDASLSRAGGRLLSALIPAQGFAPGPVHRMSGALGVCLAQFGHWP